MGWEDYNIYGGSFFSGVTKSNTLNSLRKALIERAERVNIDVPDNLKYKVVYNVEINWIKDFEGLLSLCIPRYKNFFSLDRPAFTEASLLIAIGDAERLIVEGGKLLTFAWCYQRYKMINCLLLTNYFLIADTHASKYSAKKGLYLGNFKPGHYVFTYEGGAYNCWSTDEENTYWNVGINESLFFRYNLFVATGNNVREPYTSWQRLKTFSSTDYTYRTKAEAEAYFTGKKELVYREGDSYLILADGGEERINYLGYALD
jgi:hypothetical protein